MNSQASVDVITDRGRDVLVESFVHGCLDSLRPHEAGREDAVCAIDGGLAGDAFALFACFEVSRENHYLEAAQSVLRYVLDNLGVLRDSNEVDTDRYPNSLYHSKAGLWLTAALIRDRSDEPVERRLAIDAFLQVSRGKGTHRPRPISPSPMVSPACSTRSCDTRR
jgi:hypothetical protein